MKLNWRREIRLIEPDALVDVVNGGSPPATVGWTVVNYDLLGKGAAWVGKSAWAGVIDEALDLLAAHVVDSAACKARRGVPGAQQK